MDTLIEFCILFILLSVTVRWTLTAGTDGGRLRERREREDFTKVLFCILLTLIILFVILGRIRGLFSGSSLV